MNQNYKIVRDINGFRVLFEDPDINPRNEDLPQHRDERAAREWAEEILRLEEQGRRIAAELAD